MVSVRGNQTNNKVTASSSTSTNNRAEVKPVNINNQVEATNNLAKHYSEISQDWAIGEGLIQNIDYSSKTYALQAKESATEAKASLDEAKGYTSDAVEEIQNLENLALSNISMLEQSASSTVEQGISNIGETVSEALTTLETASDATIEEIISVSDKIINRVGFELFDTKLSDHILTYEETKGWALQGTFVYKEAIAGERYGYPDFYAKCLEEYNEATATETVNGVTVKVHSNGHKFYDIANKTAIDGFFNAMGSAWMYGIDQENERVSLPRNNYFDQATGDVSEVGDSIQAGLPNINASLGNILVKASEAYASGALNVTQYFASNVGTGSNYYNYAYFDFYASRSSAVYGRSSTVQPNAVKKLLYICVGNTVSNTSWIDAVTQVEAGVKDLEDKTLEGIERLKQSSTALTQTQITNCLLEVPQRIKLELNNGTLTLKAGSVVIVPNGFEADGTTPKFDEVIVPEDLTYQSGTNWDTGNYFFTYNVTNNELAEASQPNSISGTTEPTTNYSYCYDTTNNLMKYRGTSLSTSRYSFPIAIVLNPDGNKFTSISQVFNGMGFIGSTVWVDKGVKGLIPNGRNVDGSLNNVEFTTDKILTSTNTTYEYFPDIFLNSGLTLYNTKFLGDFDNPPAVVDYSTYYNSFENLMYASTDSGEWIKQDVFKLGKVNGTTNITSFNYKQPFRAVDYSDKSTVTSWGFPSSRQVTLSFGASGSSYTAPANGWFTAKGMSTANIAYIDMATNKNIYSSGWISAANNATRGCVEVAKGDVMTMSTYNVSNVEVKFIYAQGEA